MTRMSHALPILSALLASLATPALAATSDWAQSEGGRMRMMASESANKGEITAVLDIEPNAGWKTYWRDPGDAGVPPQIDLDGSTNLTLESVAFPVPEVVHDEEGRFIGYHGPARLLLTLRKEDPGQDANLNANVMIGLCDDICLPFQTRFTLSANEKPDAGEEALLSETKAALPAKPHDGFKPLSTVLQKDGKAIEVEYQLPDAATGEPEVAIKPSKGLRIGHPIEVRRKGDRAHISIPVRKLPKDGKPARLTVMIKSGAEAVESTLALD